MRNAIERGCVIDAACDLWNGSAHSHHGCLDDRGPQDRHAKGQNQAASAAHTRDLEVRLPFWARRAGDNYNHLFEVPTVFYAVALAIVVGGLADPLYAALAWAFLGFRMLHSIAQATVNIVAVRATVYWLSWIALAVIIARPPLTAERKCRATWKGASNDRNDSPALRS